MMKALFIFIVLVIKAITSQAQIMNHEVTPTGIYKAINVAADNSLMTNLAKAKGKDKEKIISGIIAKPNLRNPAVLYVLSDVLFESSRKSEAVFWFYVAQLRARYDLNRCADKTTAGTLAALNQMFGPKINEYAFKNLDELKIVVDKVVDFVRSNPEKYDQRWINLSGMKAMNSSLGDKDAVSALSFPENEWPAIKKNTIDSYYRDFKQAMVTIKAQKK